MKFKLFQDLGFHSFVWICCLPSFCQIWHVDKTFATYCDWRNIGWSQFCCLRYFIFISTYIFFTSLAFQGIPGGGGVKEVCNRGVAWSLLKLDGGWQATPSITKFIREDSISKQRMQPSKFLLSNGFVVNLSITFNKLPWRKQLKMMSLDLVLRMNPSKLFYLCHYNEFVPTYLYHI